jgi:hypothetical protein
MIQEGEQKAGAQTYNFATFFVESERQEYGPLRLEAYPEQLIHGAQFTDSESSSVRRSRKRCTYKRFLQSPPPNESKFI